MTSHNEELPARHRRVILERIQGGRAVGTGPLAGGLQESDKIAVASFFNPYVCRRFRRALTAAGVDSAVKADGRKTTVEVKYGKLEEASRILATQQEEYPDRRPHGLRRDFDFTLLGGALGATIGVVSFSFSQHLLVRGIAWGGFIGSGVMVGYFVDRFCRSYRYLGHVRFDITDCLLLTAAMAVLISFWNILSGFL